ncbi:MAG: MOSC domain-containing protein [Melioribacteraceae bacterium]|nr:MOSC domain-containing protein [Melioribacteraceae bacterium]
MNEIILSGIYIYPVKSLGGISLESSEVVERGLKYDRRWMLVDENGLFITQRKFSKLVHFKLSFAENGFEVLHKTTNDKIVIPFETDSTETITVNVWNDFVKAKVVSEKISNWFTKKLDMKCNLVFMDEDSIRKVENKPWVTDEIVSFADAYPFLIISEESLTDLNSRLIDKVEMDRFRPNFVVTGCNAYEEDEWSEFKIGGLNFKGVKSCARCVITTIDQNSGEKNSETLNILSTFRNTDNKIMFGMNLLHLCNGRLSLYDKIEVIKRKII